MKPDATTQSSLSPRFRWKVIGVTVAGLALLSVMVFAAIYVSPIISLLGDNSDEENGRVYRKNGYQISDLVLFPAVPEVGDQQVTIRLLDDQNQPVSDAEVEIEAFMPAMGPMPAMSIKAMAEHLGEGRYQAELEISFDGTWELPIRVRRPGEARYTEFPFNINLGVEGFIYKGRQGPGQAAFSTASSLYLSPPRRQLIGVEIGKVERREIAREIRTVARLEVDESRVFDVVLKYNGYIEKLNADRTGEFTRKGQPLFEIYSPELYTAQAEYLDFFNNRNRSSFTQKMLRTAREKLQLLDLNDSQIAKLEEQGKPQRRHPIYSPISGFILKKNLVAGSFVKAGNQIYQIVDLSSLWTLADLFEQEAMLVKIGDPVTLRLSYYPGQTIQGELSYIYPTVDAATRTVKVRIETPNPDYSLRPGMYADVTIFTNQGKRLALPRRAVLFSGMHKYVFVALGEGNFEPREIQTGIQNGDWFEITEGLKDGDSVSFSANFLISSEAQLKNALPRWGKPLVTEK